MSHLPIFTNIDPKKFVHQLSNLLDANLRNISSLLQNNSDYTWDNLMYPLDCMANKLERLWSPLSHLHAVVNSKELRACYEECLPKLTLYESEIGQNRALYDAINAIDQGELNDAQRKIITDELLAFRLSGVALPLEQQERYQFLST